jgi:ATP-dependent exoDNAse (exonuclease V) alpha subunit
MAQHISVRVPWKDNGYSGLVCNKPCYNNACLRLKSIVDKRNDALEEQFAAQKIQGHETEIPCVGEGGVFMSQDTHRKTTIHPYKESNPDTHGHFLETELIYPPFSFPARPFGWTMLRKGETDNISSLAEWYNIKYEKDLEPNLPFKTNWTQDARNQRVLFNTFYSNVKPRQSLCIAYAKQVPFIEDAKRVIMGIGFVNEIIPSVEHNHTEEKPLRSITWETMVCHSIRDDRKNGFLFPYIEMMKYAEEHPDFDINSVTVFAADEYFDEFSYATEWISYDALIDVLLQSLKALEIIKTCIPGNWDDCLAWARARLAEVWEDRGAYPGLGSMLCAMHFKYGLVIAEEFKAKISAEKDFWQDFENALKNPQGFFSEDIAAAIDPTVCGAYLRLSDERKTLFRLLARFSLRPEQAALLYNAEQRQKHGINLTDTEIISNPYLVYEKTCLAEPEYQIAVKKVDRAVFPPLKIREKYPLDKPSALASENDERRLRAIAVSILEEQTAKGHTVFPQNNLVAEMKNMPLDPPCIAAADILNSISGYFCEEGKGLVLVEMENGGTAYQLHRLHDIDCLIRRSVDKRLNANRHDITENWRGLVDKAFGRNDVVDAEEKDQEEKARQEKTAILKELAEARLSVLIGGAGTGKTTLLSLLCKSDKIANGGILLLAPTGKARVRMSQAMKKQDVSFDAKTVAQFLLPNKRYRGRTMRYQISDIDAKDVPNTVIIDECSMLTEEMFGALMEALRKNAQRIILTGDPNQLPPIGAGRPFVDLVNHLKKDISPALFPKTGKSYGELTITRRQRGKKTGELRMDTELAKWYTGANTESLNESAFEQLAANQCGSHITFKKWETNEELESLLFNTLQEELGLSGIDDIDGFNRSLGGEKYFNIGAGESAEKWQILAPVRGMPHGVININHLIHEKYRTATIELAQKTKTRDCPRYEKKIPAPMGAENIVYGDKVIHLMNKKRNGYNWDTKESLDDYVVNGEIGIASQCFGKSLDHKYLKIEFSSQPRITYSFTDWGDEGEIPLELAFALTVHKAQGSEFETVILIIAEPCRLLSKELLYTAITRQSKKLIIMYNTDAYHLRNYASMCFSDIASRFTALFEKPKIIQINKRYYEEKLIHKTLRNEFVRSKSEVIIANMLTENKVSYEYEKELVIDGIKKIPDFTIEDAESGITWYWEHCGMIHDTAYLKHWEEKKAFYAAHGIEEGKNLIITYDNKNGGIDSIYIRNIIQQYF